MAAKSKKRLSKIENKLLKLNKLQLTDVLCSICQSVLVEPVTLPCYHDFCQACFKGSVENNALCCPLCRLRIGSWLRTATKQKNLVNVQLWDFIRSKFQKEINKKLLGEDIKLPENHPVPRLSEPGEIRQEYEAELKRLRAERLHLEQKHLHETELLVKKLEKEEEEANNRYTERLKRDELLAKEIQEHKQQAMCNISTVSNKRTKNSQNKLKATKLDSFLIKKKTPVKVKDSPLLTDDNTSTDSSTPKTDSTYKQVARPSPELVPSYGSFLKTFLDKKIRNVTGLWNKENGVTSSKKETPIVKVKEDIQNKEVNANNIPKKNIQSVPVSLPYKGILQRKLTAHKSRTAGTDSVDSMREELCYFRPIETAPTSLKHVVGLPLKIPSVRAAGEVGEACPLQLQAAPTRAQYVDRLCQLRQHSLTPQLPSAFVVALKILHVKKGHQTKQEGSLKIKLKKQVPISVYNGPSLPAKDNTALAKDKNSNQIDGIAKLSGASTLRRTRSMGSVAKRDNETTPKKAKAKERKACSERKPHLRSDSKKSKLSSVPEIVISNQKVNSVVKNLSSPLKNCDVKVILEEQMRIEMMIEQEKGDLELARRMEAEWNGRGLRRAAKRGAPLTLQLASAKKVRV